MIRRRRTVRHEFGYILESGSPGEIHSLGPARAGKLGQNFQEAFAEKHQIFFSRSVDGMPRAEIAQSGK